MERAIRWIINSGVILFVLGCGERLSGTYYLSEIQKKYVADTTIAYFEMEDQNGISDGFYIDRSTFGHGYPNHLFVNKATGDLYLETFNISYTSSIYGFHYSVIMRPLNGYDNPYIEIFVSQRDGFEYDFTTKKSFGYGNRKTFPKVNFKDSLSVRGKSYVNIIEIDFTEKAQALHEETPVKMTISGKDGLISFTLNSGIVYERKP